MSSTEHICLIPVYAHVSACWLWLWPGWAGWVSECPCQQFRSISDSRWPGGVQRIGAGRSADSIRIQGDPAAPRTKRNSGRPPSFSRKVLFQPEHCFSLALFQLQHSFIRFVFRDSPVSPRRCLNQPLFHFKFSFNSVIVCMFPEKHYFIHTNCCRNITVLFLPGLFQHSANDSDSRADVSASYKESAEHRLQHAAHRQTRRKATNDLSPKPNSQQIESAWYSKLGRPIWLCGCARRQLRGGIRNGRCAAKLVVWLRTSAKLGIIKADINSRYLELMRYYLRYRWSGMNQVHSQFTARVNEGLIWVLHKSSRFPIPTKRWCLLTTYTRRRSRSWHLNPRSICIIQTWHNAYTTSITPYVAIDERGLVRSINLFLFFSCMH